MMVVVLSSVSYACEHQDYESSKSSEVTQDKVHSEDDSCDMDTESYEVPEIDIDKEDF